MLESLKTNIGFVIAIITLLFLLLALIKIDIATTEALIELKNDVENQRQEIKDLKETTEKIKISKTKAKEKEKANLAVSVPVSSTYKETKAIPGMVKNTFGSDFSVLVAKCESASFKPAVVYGPQVGSAGERGVMQIHPVHSTSGALKRAGFTWDDMFIPEKNIAFGKVLLDSVGGTWYPTWTCANLV